MAMKKAAKKKGKIIFQLCEINLEYSWLVKNKIITQKVLHLMLQLEAQGFHISVSTAIPQNLLSARPTKKRYTTYTIELRHSKEI